MRLRPMTDEYIPYFERYITLVPFEQILSDFRIVREATLSLTKALSEDAWSRCCTVWEHSTFARAFAYIIAGRELHHRTILQERYVPHIS